MNQRLSLSCPSMYFEPSLAHREHVYTWIITTLCYMHLVLLFYLSPYVKDIHLVFNHTCKYVNKQLEDQGIRNELVDKIPFVSAGWINTAGPVNPERYLWYVSDKANTSDLMEKIDFLSELWVTCFERVPGGISRLKFTYKCNLDIRPKME